MLNGDPAIQCLDAFQIPFRDRFGMVEEPAQACEWNVPINRFKDIEKAANRFVVGRVQPKRPAILDEKTHDLGQFRFERCGKVRAWFQEVLEVRRGKHQHFAGAVHAIEVAARAGLGHFDPPGEIIQLLLWPLREQVIRDADRHFTAAMQVFNDLVIVRIILEAAAGIDATGHSQSIKFAHEMAS